MEVRLNISPETKDISIDITAPSRNSEVEQIMKLLNERMYKKVYGIQNHATFIVDLVDIICFYTDDKKVYLKTTSGEFEVKSRMYEIEENVIDNSFIRISNSVIANINHVKCFDTAQIGNIIVRFDDGSFEYVSKRKIPAVMKILKGRNEKNEKRKC